MFKGNLNETYQIFIDELLRATKDRDHGMHIIQFGSLSKKGPEIRSVVLRRLESKPLKIYFHTHINSPKITEIQQDPRTTIHAYCKIQKKQLRFSGRSQILTSGSIYDDQTQKMTASASRCYLSPYSPSSSIPNYHPNLPEEYLYKAPTSEEKLSHYPKMAVIEFTPLELDALWLRAEGHVRIEANFFGNQLELGWLAP